MCASVTYTKENWIFLLYFLLSIKYRDEVEKKRFVRVEVKLCVCVCVCAVYHDNNNNSMNSTKKEI